SIIPLVRRPTAVALTQNQSASRSLTQAKVVPVAPYRFPHESQPKTSRVQTGRARRNTGCVFTHTDVPRTLDRIEHLRIVCSATTAIPHHGPSIAMRIGV